MVELDSYQAAIFVSLKLVVHHVTLLFEEGFYFLLTTYSVFLEYFWNNIFILYACS